MRLEALAGLGAAIFVLVAVATIWRVIVLHGKSEAASDIENESNKVNQVSAEYSQATNALNLATNALAETKSQISLLTYRQNDNR